MTESSKEMLENYKMWIAGMALNIKLISQEEFIKNTDSFITDLLKAHTTFNTDEMKAILDGLLNTISRSQSIYKIKETKGHCNCSIEVYNKLIERMVTDLIKCVFDCRKQLRNPEDNA